MKERVLTEEGRGNIGWITGCVAVSLRVTSVPHFFLIAFYELKYYIIGKFYKNKNKSVVFIIDFSDKYVLFLIKYATININMLSNIYVHFFQVAYMLACNIYQAKRFLKHIS